MPDADTAVVVASITTDAHSTDETDPRDTSVAQGSSAHVDVPSTNPGVWIRYRAQNGTVTLHRGPGCTGPTSTLHAGQQGQDAVNAQAFRDSSGEHAAFDCVTFG